MKYHNILRTALFCTLVLQSIDSFAAETTFKFRTKNRKIYHKGWIDLNKNGVKDVYEDPSADIDARVEDLLSQMTLEEKNLSDGDSLRLWSRSRRSSPYPGVEGEVVEGRHWSH